MEVKIVKKHRIFNKWFFILIFLFFLIVIPFLLAVGWVNWAFGAPTVRAKKETVFVIKPKESIDIIAQRLKKEELIRDVNGFKLYLKVSCTGFSFYQPWTWFKNYKTQECLSSQIQAGSFKLRPDMDLKILTNNLTKGRLDSWVRLIEGSRNEEMAAVLAKNYSIKEANFLKAASIGYMFPDTYLFKVTSTASEIAEKMRSTFETKVSAEIRAGLETQGLSLAEGIILASIIERETRNTDERPIIAGILLKRLREGWKLEVDATVQFALGYSEAEKTWWKKGLTVADLAINSPYNTRRFPGLPPGPICNPGLSAIKAVASPVKSSHYFYLHGSDGKVHYANTLDEHNANKAKFLK